jgi:hypothetical protein
MSGPPNDVSFRSLSPFAFATQISGDPERVEVNATLCPSGEYSAFWSIRVDAMKSSAAEGASPVRAIRARQIPVCRRTRE